MSEKSQPFEIFKKNGGIIYIHENYQYTQVRMFKSGATYLRCTNYKRQKCKASITFKDINILKKIPHTCVMDGSQNVILMEINKLKIKAAESDLPITRLYNDSISGMLDKGLNFVAEMPKLSKVKSGLYDTRHKAIGASKTVFRCYGEVEVPQIHSDFLLCEYEDENNRMLVFCSKESLSELTKTKEFFIDATFQSCPKPFYQLLTIHGDFGSSEDTVHTKPLIYALMPDKKQITYTILFELLKIKLSDLKISILHCDFEVALCNAITAAYPDVSIKGCFYHWTRNMWRRAKKLNHKCKEERRIVGLCAILPLLPETSILDGWNYVKTEYQESCLRMPRFMAYVNHLLKKRIYLKIISVFGQRHRTNNVLESFHSKLNKVFNKNVTLLRLLNFVSKNEKLNKLQTPTKRNRKYANKDGIIRHIMMQLLNNNITLGHAMEKLR